MGFLEETQPKKPHDARSVFRIFRELVTPGVVGRYNGCEVYNFFFQAPSSSTPINLYTLVRFGDFAERSFSESPAFLNRRRIRVGGNFVAGIYYFRKSLIPFALFYRRFLRTNIWDLGGTALSQNASRPLPRQYVPADNTFPPALNKVLKNNFFGGSYLIEHFDEEKVLCAPWRERPELLELLSAEVSRYVPLKIASVSDRLGNIVLQFPVEAVRSTFNVTADGRQVRVGLKSQRPEFGEREFAVVASNEGDKARYLHGFGFSRISSEAGNVAIQNDEGTHRNLLIDVGRNLVLGSFYGTYIDAFHTTIDLIQPEPRVIQTSNGVERVDLVGISTVSIVGNSSETRPRHWEQARIFDDETRELEERRGFVQYGAQTGKTPSEAIKDIVELIRRHGREGVWLWDPYLQARDIIDTIFRCPYVGVASRALGSALVIPNRSLHGRQAWIAEQSTVLQSGGPQSRRGLKVEFRFQHGRHGWKFHDRFLIFPRKGRRPLVWSLGTSLNSFGTDHHILQEVSHPTRILKAYEELWSSLQSPECLVWQTPAP